MLNFRKNTVVGVSVHPERGLEIAQVDFATKTVLKYGCKELGYDNTRREIADLDIFKETLLNLLTELQIPKGSELVLNIPAAAFKIADYPAAISDEQRLFTIEEELEEKQYFKENEPCISAEKLSNSTIQFTKVAYEAVSKSMLIEIAMQIKDLGYRIAAIDTTVNSILNALIYNERVNVAPDSPWVLLVVENNCCRLISMIGKNYVDYSEEKVSIGEVLGDAENYSTVVNAINPRLQPLGNGTLYIVSNTNIISAQELAGKLKYKGQIIHQEDNYFMSEPFLSADSSIENPKMVSLEVIGAAINDNFQNMASVYLNLYNDSLGDIYLLEQPPVILMGNRKLVLSLENMIIASAIFFVAILILIALILIPLSARLKAKDAQIADLDREIEQIDKALKENDSVSADLFDEGDEIRMGLMHNKNIYSYYMIVGTEIPEKLWLTSLDLGKNTTIEGQADNLESVYSFFRNIKDYNPESAIKLQKLGLASSSAASMVDVVPEGDTDQVLDTKSILTSMNADFYEFKISDAPENAAPAVKNDNTTQNSAPAATGLPDLE